MLLVSYYHNAIAIFAVNMCTLQYKCSNNYNITKNFTPFCRIFYNTLYNMNTDKILGERLKSVREALKLSQEDLSIKLLGKRNRSTISAYENGRLPIADKAKVIIFTTLGVNKEWFETGEGEMFTDNTQQNISIQKPKSKLKAAYNEFLKILLLDNEWSEDLDKQVKDHMKKLDELIEKNEQRNKNG